MSKFQKLPTDEFNAIKTAIKEQTDISPKIYNKRKAIAGLDKSKEDAKAEEKAAVIKEVTAIVEAGEKDPSAPMVSKELYTKVTRYKDDDSKALVARAKEAFAPQMETLKGEKDAEKEAVKEDKLAKKEAVFTNVREIVAAGIAERKETGKAPTTEMPSGDLYKSFAGYVRVKDETAKELAAEVKKAFPEQIKEKQAASKAKLAAKEEKTPGI